MSAHVSRAPLLDALFRAFPHSLRQDVKIARALAFELVGSRRFSSPSLNGLEARLAPYLPSAPGIFLEIGANNGYSQSNTYRLERELGWRGILVEPIPQLARRCRWVRPRSVVFNVACAADDDDSTLVMASQGLTSVVLGLQRADHPEARVRSGSKRLQVQVKTLSSVIDDSPFSHVDFASIDVEGAELDVLAGLDLERHAPSVLLVETERLSDVRRALEPHLELGAQLSHHDYLFVSAQSASAH